MRNIPVHIYPILTAFRWHRKNLHFGQGTCVSQNFKEEIYI